MGKGRLTPKAIKKKKRNAEMLKMREAGMTYREIAEAVGLAGKQSAHEALQKEFQNITAVPMREMREKEKIRLEAVIEANWKKAMSGDFFSCKIILDAVARLGKFFGLEINKHEITGAEGKPLFSEIIQAAGEKLALPVLTGENGSVEERRDDGQGI